MIIGWNSIDQGVLAVLGRHVEWIEETNLNNRYENSCALGMLPGVTNVSARIWNLHFFSLICSHCLLYEWNISQRPCLLIRRAYRESFCQV